VDHFRVCRKEDVAVVTRSLGGKPGSAERRVCERRKKRDGEKHGKLCGGANSLRKGAGGGPSGRKY
jgi:hypothetical protein